MEEDKDVGQLCKQLNDKCIKTTSESKELEDIIDVEEPEVDFSEKKPKNRLSFKKECNKKSAIPGDDSSDIRLATGVKRQKHIVCIELVDFDMFCEEMKRTAYFKFLLASIYKTRVYVFVVFSGWSS